MSKLREELKQLSKGYPEPSKKRMEHCLPKLDRMLRFYDEKQHEAPERQGFLFKGFVTALTYAIITVTRYREVTAKLRQLAYEEEAKEK